MNLPPLEGSEADRSCLEPDPCASAADPDRERVALLLSVQLRGSLASGVVPSQCVSEPTRESEPAGRPKLTGYARHTHHSGHSTTTGARPPTHLSAGVRERRVTDDLRPAARGTGAYRLARKVVARRTPALPVEAMQRRWRPLPRGNARHRSHLPAHQRGHRLQGDRHGQRDRHERLPSVSDLAASRSNRPAASPQTQPLGAVETPPRGRGSG